MRLLARALERATWAAAGRAMEGSSLAGASAAAEAGRDAAAAVSGVLGAAVGMAGNVPCVVCLTQPEGAAGAVAALKQSRAVAVEPAGRRKGAPARFCRLATPPPRSDRAVLALVSSVSAATGAQVRRLAGLPVDKLLCCAIGAAAVAAIARAAAASLRAR